MKACFIEIIKMTMIYIYIKFYFYHIFIIYTWLRCDIMHIYIYIYIAGYLQTLVMCYVMASELIRVHVLQLGNDMCVDV